MIRGVKDLNTLNNIKEYIQILLIESIYGDSKNNQKAIQELERERNQIKYLRGKYSDDIPLIIHGFSSEIPNFSLTQEQLIENLKSHQNQFANSSARHFPKDPNEKPSDLLKKYYEPLQNKFKDRMTLLTKFCRHVALKFYKHPGFRSWMYS